MQEQQQQAQHVSAIQQSMSRPMSGRARLPAVPGARPASAGLRRPASPSGMVGHQVRVVGHVLWEFAVLAGLRRPAPPSGMICSEMQIVGFSSSCVSECR